MNDTRSIVAFLHVMDLAASVAFYARIGFRVESSTETWRWLQSGDAALMLAQAAHPVDASAQGVWFYVYVDDVAAKHAQLTADGVACGAIANPSYNPRGEFRIGDPDGYTLFVTHTGT